MANRDEQKRIPSSETVAAPSVAVPEGEAKPFMQELSENPAPPSLEIDSDQMRDQLKLTKRQIRALNVEVDKLRRDCVRLSSKTVDCPNCGFPSISCHEAGGELRQKAEEQIRNHAQPIWATPPTNPVSTAQDAVWLVRHYLGADPLTFHDDARERIRACLNALQELVKDDWKIPEVLAGGVSTAGMTELGNKLADLAEKMMDVSSGGWTERAEVDAAIVEWRAHVLVEKGK